ncbi:Phosphate transporter family protein [Acanthamoeba castellanii str. Neff]|uniref:Phosphate transporter n=1 Tax=Acanthamoeba castellanii (strain ATCC 30010 / Neff) TaxID=1257118 RepID=L8GTH7_ACACF|nr:Phosphate transporter family protein [Acanthamoeba castellanii str. Neff]ELR15426.1 Phosphate transporter family protein [Acanthamoeba castellanii str. Neff]
MLLWVAVVGGVISFILAWALGANDVANAFGTSVGSKVLSLRQAIVIAAIVEFAGAVLMGSHVVDALRKDIIKPSLYADNPEELMVGMLSALIAAAAWLVLATFLNLPVSTTHGMVGAIVGFTLVAKGFDGVEWWQIGKICISWVTSPVLAGLLSFTMYFLVRFFILRRSNSLTLGFRFLPFFYALTLGALTFFIIYKGSPGLGLDGLALWLIALLCGGVALAALLFCFVIVVPYLRDRINRLFDESGERRILQHTSTTTSSSTEGSSVFAFASPYAYFRRIWNKLRPGRAVEVSEDVDSEKKALSVEETILADDSEKEGDDGPDANEEMYAHSEVFDERTEELFSFLQVLTACVGGFAHGSNDVSNAIAPFVVIISIYRSEDVSQDEDTPWWVLVMGGAAIVLGLAMWGYRVMATVGHNMTKLTSSRGFNIEFGAAMTVLIASRLSIPISTTHCVVGSVFAVGLADGIKAVNWRLFINIVLSWVITLPITLGLAAATFALLDLFY